MSHWKYIISKAASWRPSKEITSTTSTMAGSTTWRLAALLQAVTAAAAILASPAIVLQQAGQVQKDSMNRTLKAWAIAPLPLGTIKPGGWLGGELKAMADGLAGHELDMYPFVQNSPWLYPPGSGQGSDYSGLHEALPYWFNGIVPLAYSLDDDRLKQQAKQVLTTVLSLRAADAWIGPETGSARNFWGRVPFLLGMMQLAEADPSVEGQIVDALRSFLSLAHTMLLNGGQGFSVCPGMSRNDCSWGQARAHDFMLVVQWLLERYPSDQDAMLWEIVDLLYDLNQFKWEDWYQESVYQAVIAQPNPDNPYFPYLHGVNVGQGLKASAVIRRNTHNDSLLQSTWKGISWTFRDHGAPSGTILADEIERDSSSFMGSELCTAVETMYSLSYLYLALGNNTYADMAELTAFNALPTMLTDDMWAHQYMSRPNLPFAGNQISQPALYTTASGAAAIFGLEPMYPCCTVNHVQGWPKLVMNSWGRGQGALVHSILGPSSINTTVNGGKVQIDCETDYPFADALTYYINSEQPFDLFLRVPNWTTDSFNVTVSWTVPTDGLKLATSATPDPDSGLYLIQVPAGVSNVTYSITRPLRVERRPNGNAVSVYVGNLLYSLDLSPSEEATLPHPYTNPGGPGTTQYNSTWPQVRDFYFNATTPWNIAIDPNTVRTYTSPENSTASLQRAFGNQGNTNYLMVLGCQVDWSMNSGVTPDVPPVSPVCIAPGKYYRMIPYGGAKVHMSELPTVSFTAGSFEQDPEVRLSDTAASEL
jgi:hypothetical protein